ncbi:MAG TPA: hypothetical protein VGL95_01840 [Acetobacteraceae bacterium]|jgi:hypothetical protein
MPVLRSGRDARPRRTHPCEGGKDNVTGGVQELEFDFVADNPGLTLFHRHQQLRMNFWFMALF